MKSKKIIKKIIDLEIKENSIILLFVFLEVEMQVRQWEEFTVEIQGLMSKCQMAP